MINEHHFRYLKTARYSIFGIPKPGVKLWIVLHGYGQLASNFIKAFQTLDPDRNFVIAPEGLHRFYVDASHQKVGSTWMTKEDRATDISDYLEMLNDLYTIIQKKYRINFDSLHVVGFSQGTATASRWAIARPELIDTLTLCGGDFANEIDSEQIKKLSAQIKITLLNGKQDEIFNIKQQKKLVQKLRSISDRFTIISHEGAHRIPIHLIQDL